MSDSKPSLQATWLKDEEFRVSELLAGRSLVVEANLSEDEVRRIQDFYGPQAAGMLRVGCSPADVVKRYPALTLAILVGQAGLAYEEAKYWKKFFDQLGMRREPKFENELRSRLSWLLRKHKLTRFDELGNRFVERMALHAGFPAYCLGDLLRTIEAHFVAGREHSGAAIMEWLTEPGKQHRMNALDVPVRNFLTFGGEFALDILGRIVEFVDFVVDNPDSWNTLDLDTSTTGLPTMLLGALIDELEANPIGGERGTPSGTRRARKARLSFAVAENLVQLELPHPPDADSQPWRLSFDGDTREVWAERGWGVDGDEHPPTIVSVGTPVREVVAAHGDVAEVVPVVDRRDPLLIFTADGRPIGRGAALPSQIVAVYPSDAQVVNPLTRLPVAPVVAPQEPVGWSGWTAAHLHLGDEAAVQLVRAGVPCGVARPVRPTASATIELGESVAAVRTPTGLSVYANRPEVTLPAHVAGQSLDWRVQVRRDGERTWLIDHIWTADEFETVLDPFDGEDPGLLGLFEIVVTGPLGRGLRQRMFLAEGLAVEPSRPFRFPAASGLIPISVEIGCATGVTVDRSELAFGATDRELPIRVTGNGRSHRLVVNPPAVELRVTPVGKPAQWRTTAPVLRPKDLEQYAVIAARIPGRVWVRFAVLRDEHPIGTVDPDRLGGNVFTAPTRSFVDMIRDAGDCRVVARITQFDGTAVSVTVAHIRPDRMCRAVRVDGTALVFDGLAVQDDLAAHVWAVTAPWRPVDALPIVGSRAELPTELVGGGPLQVEVFVDDPWVTITPPSWAGPNAWRVEQPGWVAGSDDDLDGLARYLAGAGEIPGSAPLPHVWAALVQLPREEWGKLREIPHSDPRRALEALGDSTIPPNRMGELLIRTGLVNRAYSADFTLNDLHPNPWVGCMVEISDLPSLFARRDVVADERAETLGYLADKGGDLLIETLRLGKARGLYEGAFDRTVELMGALPAAQVDEIVAAANLVPGALLDLDTRASGNFEAFHARREWPASNDFTAATLRSLEKIRRENRLLYNVIVARHEALEGVDTVTNPWMLMSLQSLTMAVLARLDAHGALRYAQLTPDLTEPWALLAQLAPRMVLSDLLIAEALVTFVRHGDLIGVIR